MSAAESICICPRCDRALRPGERTGKHRRANTAGMLCLGTVLRWCECGDGTHDAEEWCQKCDACERCCRCGWEEGA